MQWFYGDIDGLNLHPVGAAGFELHPRMGAGGLTNPNRALRSANRGPHGSPGAEAVHPSVDRTVYPLVNFISKPSVSIQNTVYTILSYLPLVQFLLPLT
jgi:hypothetical protein